ncbi:hypothetical protein [Deinococcus aquiradiocola]|uniref:Uncharacterized protein n=1 Tax=Deinococcus aquiradiocola TaxID=393059 RepID=A0A917UII4_9DEIO|nr:hypothetical protein [Deinococcus aquiradiocola]GGJ60776.1 hypothetical protein GCM10008939_00650 [Deinococcus aquiradiocola]
MTRAPVSELLLEYQHYLMAHRLRSLFGGPLMPPARLTLPEYASRRLTRQDLARQMITRASPPEAMRQMDRLTDELMFGFWHNPAEVTAFLRAAIRQGSHPALGEPDEFARLLSPAERARLGPDGVDRVCRHYLTCLHLAAPGVDPHALEHLFQRIDANTPPLFADELTFGTQELPA